MKTLDDVQDDAHVVDRILRTRSHVRIVRVLVNVDPSVNMTVRGLAKQAGISHVQAGRTVLELEQAGLIAVRRGDGYSFVELNEKHLLAPALCTLFEEELRVLEEVHGQASHEAKRRGLIVRVEVLPGVGSAWEVRLTSRHPFDWGERRWANQLEADLRGTTGLDLVVRVRAAQDRAKDRLLADLDAR